jgi:hypothetical protein
MRTNILRAFVVVLAVAAVMTMGITNKNAYSQSSSSSGGCCAGMMGNTNTNTNTSPVNCSQGYHQVGTGSSASCVSDTANSQ